VGAPRHGGVLGECRDSTGVGTVRVVIVVAGVTNVELTVPVDRFPVPYTSVRYVRQEIGIRVAGVGFGTAAALTALGADVRLATFVGEDHFGSLVQTVLHDRRLWTAGVIAAPTTPVSVVLHDSEGRRMINTDLKDLPDADYPNSRFAQLLADAELAVVTNIGFARPLLALAAGLGVPIAADVQAVDSLDDAYNADWMRAAAVLFCSHERLPCSPDDWITGVWDRYGCGLVVVGCGPGGAVLGVRGDREIRRVPAIAPRGVTNTVGAGDALAAAFLHVLTRSGDPHLAIEQAVLFAGHRVGAASGEDGWLSGDELAALHRERQRS
jgi:acarbose 7IV-phosphotransferase